MSFRTLSLHGARAAHTPLAARAMPGTNAASHTPLIAPAVLLPGARHGLRHVEHVMGMPVMFDICDAEIGLAVLRSVVAWLHWVDRTFSTYRADSQIARLNRGELNLAELHPDVQEVLERCEQLRLQTGGYFDIHAPYRRWEDPLKGARGPMTAPAAGYGGPRGIETAPAAGYGGPGSIEPSGLVKGWAVAGVVERLRAAGARNFAVNAGGDGYYAGHPDLDAHWRVGVQHPRDPDAIALTLGLRDQGIATSGAYARGAHIVDPVTGRVPRTLLSVTIVGPEIVTADAYATAAFAMGSARARAFCAGLDGYGAALIGSDDTITSTVGLSLAHDHRGHTPILGHPLESAAANQ